MIPDSVFLGKTDDGLGDRILYCDMVHFINELCPNTKVYICDPCEELVTLLGITGCVFRICSSANHGENYCPHFIYRRGDQSDGLHMIRSMYNSIRIRIPGLPELPSHISLASCVLKSNIKVPEDYIIVPSFEPMKASSFHKGNNYELMNDIVMLLNRRGHKVLEINTWVEHPKFFTESKGIIFTHSFVDSAKILASARLCITYENGLNHWACHNGAKTLCLFTTTKALVSPERMSYPAMTLYDIRKGVTLDNIADKLTKVLGK